MAWFMRFKRFPPTSRILRYLDRVSFPLPLSLPAPRHKPRIPLHSDPLPLCHRCADLLSVLVTPITVRKKLENIVVVVVSSLLLRWCPIRLLVVVVVVVGRIAVIVGVGTIKLFVDVTTSEEHEFE